MKIEDMQALRKELGLTYEMIAEKAQMPVSTVQKVLGGITKSPRRDTLIKLERIIADEQKSRYVYNPADTRPSQVSEADPAEADKTNSGAYHKISAHKLDHSEDRQGSFTIEDYYKIPDDRRVELINGYIYDFAAPTTVHQTIIMHIGYILWGRALKSSFHCRPFTAPVDVRLHRDNKTMLQPDIIAICENDAEDNGRCIDGAPDFVIEVLSPTTRVRDLSIKLAEYKRAGVREYWIIDPDKYIVTVHIFEGAGDLFEYTFDDKVPVAISNGDLVIDFAELKSILEGSYGTQKQQRNDS